MKKQQLALAVILVVGVLVYKSWSPQTTMSAHATAAEGRFRIAAQAETFRFGTLDFSRCELDREHSGATTEAWCAPFQVPENRGDPTARKLDLKVALIRSAQAADDDFIVYLAGGPGQSAIETWPQIAGALGPARKRRHVLLLDQRGTGDSNALECEALAANEEALEFDPAHVGAATRACLQQVAAHADPRYYTTADAVADLEDLRQALGAPTFDLVGVSYGTRLAQQYLRHHAEGVRSVVLDSVVPNDLVLGSEFAGNLDAALKAQFAHCARARDCAKAFPDPYAGLRQLRDQLRDSPRQVRFPDPVSFMPRHERLDAFGMVGLIRLFAYSPETAALIPHAVAQALAGNDAPLLGQIGVLSQGLQGLAGSGMPLSVICAEDADRLQANPANADTLLGNALIEAIRAQCEIWPRGARAVDFGEPIRGDTPTLVLSGEFDPVTPPRYGEQVVKSLDNARLVVAQGQGHNVIGRGCLPKLVAQFMDALDAKALDTACVDALGPIPHFIDYNGAAP